MLDQPLVPATWRLDTGNGTARFTTTALEQVFWSNLTAIADREGMTTRFLLNDLRRRRGAHTLASAVRCFVVAYNRAACVGSTFDLHRALDAIGPSPSSVTRGGRGGRPRSAVL